MQLLSDKRQFNDPSFYCKPLGVPRMGPPSQVVQTPGLVVLLYQGRNTFRTIPTDGRAHNADADWTWNGDSVGRWDGDTFVIDTTKLVEDSWLGADGWFHSNKMHVVERLSRKGDTLTWSATVEDPVVLHQGVGDDSADATAQCEPEGAARGRSAVPRAGWAAYRDGRSSLRICLCRSLQMPSFKRGARL